MSAATEFAPAVLIPLPARLGDAAARPLASVTTLHPPRDVDASAAPLRLTRRGVAAVSALVLAVAGVLLWLAARSAATGSGASVARGPARVAVQPGDTLWSIASRVAPQRDPRAEVAALVRANHLVSVDLVPGQVLRTR